MMKGWKGELLYLSNNGLFWREISERQRDALIVVAVHPCAISQKFHPDTHI